MHGVSQRWGAARGSRVALAFLTLGFAAGALPATARAADSPATDTDGGNRAQARAKLIEGDRLLKAGNFQAALEAFKRAYVLFPSPKIHYDVGLAYQGLGRNADALDAIDAFLADALDAQPDVRERARALRATLAERVGTLIVKADAGSGNVIVDGRELGAGTVERRVNLDPGPHLVLVERNGGAPPFTSRFELGARAQVIVAIPPEASLAVRTDQASQAPTAPMQPATEPSPVVALAPRPEPGRPWRIGGIAAAAGGVALVGAGALFGLAVRSASQAVSTKFDGDRDSAGRRDVTLQWVGYGVGTAAIATGVWLYVHGRKLDGAHDEARAPAYRLMAGPAGFAVEGVF